MAYVEQSYRDLTLHVVRGEVDRALFSIFAHRACELFGITFDLYIIGESHVIGYHYANETFYELFACYEALSHEALIRENVCDLESKRVRFEGFTYTFNVTITQEETALDSSADVYISHTFEGGAVTAIAVQEEENGIMIKTLHSYLSEKTYVLTTSKILFDNA